MNNQDLRFWDPNNELARIRTRTRQTMTPEHAVTAIQEGLFNPAVGCYQDALQENELVSRLDPDYVSPHDFSGTEWYEQFDDDSFGEFRHYIMMVRYKHYYFDTIHEPVEFGCCRQCYKCQPIGVKCPTCLDVNGASELSRRIYVVHNLARYQPPAHLNAIERIKYVRRELNEDHLDNMGNASSPFAISWELFGKPVHYSLSYDYHYSDESGYDPDNANLFHIISLDDLLLDCKNKNRTTHDEIMNPTSTDKFDRLSAITQVKWSDIADTMQRLVTDGEYGRREESLIRLIRERLRQQRIREERAREEAEQARRALQAHREVVALLVYGDESENEGDY